MEIHERLRQAREAAGLSQGQVAKKLDMHRPTISEIEAGRRKVNTQELSKFSELYGVSVDWLMDVDEKGHESDAKIQIAARELSQMSDSDLDRLMNMLKMIRKTEN